MAIGEAREFALRTDSWCLLVSLVILMYDCRHAVNDRRVHRRSQSADNAEVAEVIAERMMFADCRHAVISIHRQAQ